MKRKLVLFFLLALTWTMLGAAASEAPICVTVNGKDIKMEALPFLENGTTYVPIRFVSQALGAEHVSWDGAKRQAVIQHGATRMELPVNQAYGYVNGKWTAVPGGVQLISGRTFVPVRFAAETMGAKVGWNQEYYRVEITKSGHQVPAEYVAYKEYTDDQIDWLARIVSAESKGEPMAGKVGVGNVILNRVESDLFPDTIYGVIFDKKYGVQFQPIINGTIYHTPTAESRIAAKKALEGENTVGNSLYFLNPRTSTNFWIMNNRTYHSTIANHQFYL